MIVTAKAIRLICGGWLEDAARAAYDRIPYNATLFRFGTGEPGHPPPGRIWWTRGDYAWIWIGIKFQSRTPAVRVYRVGVGVGEFGIRWKS